MLVKLSFLINPTLRTAVSDNCESGISQNTLLVIMGHDYHLLLALGSSPRYTLIWHGNGSLIHLLTFLSAAQSLPKKVRWTDWRGNPVGASMGVTTFPKDMLNRIIEGDALGTLRF